MHAREPAMNVDLTTTRTSATKQHSCRLHENARVRVYRRNVRLRHTRRQRRKPAFWPPLVGVGAPDPLVVVEPVGVHPDHRSRGDDQLVGGLSVRAGDGRAEREDGVFVRAAMIA